MRHPLDGVNAKIGRAKEHLDNLAEDLTRRRQLNEYGILVHLDAKTGEQIVYAWVPYDLRVRWGLVAGDVIHNLRSALDHLICQLIRLDHPGHPCDTSEFPIYSNLAKYEKENGARKIIGVRTGAEKCIEALQPKTADDSLWLISQLDNWDKHRLVHASVGVADLGSMDIGGTGFIKRIEVTTRRAVLDDIEDGAELYRKIADPGVQVQTRPQIEITFPESGPGGGKPVLPTLSELIEYVEVVVVPQFGLHKSKARAPTWERPG